jgi:hypothetical protein
MQLLSLPHEMLEHVVHVLCPSDCLVRWKDACLFAAANKQFYHIVVATEIFKATGDSNVTNMFDHTTPCATRNQWPPTITLPWRGVTSTSTRGFKSKIVDLPIRATPFQSIEAQTAIIIERHCLKPVWKLLINLICISADLHPPISKHENRWMLTLDTRDVLTYMRCPPGYLHASINERTMLKKLSDIQNGRLSKNDYEIAHKLEPFDKSAFNSYSGIQHSISSPIRLMDFHFTLQSNSYVPSSEPQSCGCWVCWHKQGSDDDTLQRILNSFEVRLTCAFKSKSAATGSKRFFYTQDLCVNIHSKHTPGDPFIGNFASQFKPAVDFEFDRKVRDAAGYSLAHTTGRYE